MADKPANLKFLLAGPEPVFAPLVLNPMMARMAEQAGFSALYLGGGATGYVTTFTEANLSLTELARTGLDIGAACRLPLILDGACGWGDPMHLHRTIPLAEAAGFQAIEIEDQILPKRAHHHVGIEHIIPVSDMVAKVHEAVAVRRDASFVLIARTNAARTDGVDEALRRAEAYLAAGADMLFVLTRDLNVLRRVHERLAAPLMFMLGGGGLQAAGVTLRELGDLGVQLVVDPTTPLLAMHRALRDAYASLRAGRADPLVGQSIRVEEEAIHRTIGLDVLLDVERRTTERPSSDT